MFEECADEVLGLKLDFLLQLLDVFVDQGELAILVSRAVVPVMFFSGRSGHIFRQAQHVDGLVGVLNVEPGPKPLLH